MRSLWPQPADPVDLELVYSEGARATNGRPFVRVNMVSTLDGAIAVGGRSGAIGGPPDRSVFMVLRGLADVVMVGAGTVRAENYGPVRLPSQVQEARVARGQAPLPTVAVVTRSMDLDWGARLFTAAPGTESPRPVVVAPAGAGSGTARQAAPAVADLITAGAAPGPVDVQAALAALSERGWHHVLCEGGPGLNTSMVAAGAVDELCLTLSPKLAGCVGGHLVGGWLGSGSEWLSHTAPEAMDKANGRPTLARLAELELVHVLEEGSFLFLRFRAR